LAGALAGFGFFFALGVNGLGGVFSIRRKTSSSVRDFDMPQPLKRITPGPYSVQMHQAMDKADPKLVPLALAVINRASLADATFARFIALFTHGNAKPVFDYYLSLDADGPKRAAIRALAASALPSEKLILFNAVSKIYQTAQSARNPIAHWIVGYTDKVPDALLFLDPKHWLEHQGRMDPITVRVRAAYKAGDNAAIYAAIKESEDAKDLYFADIMSYREKDFVDILRDIDAAIDLMNEFDNVLSFDAVNPGEGEKLAGELIGKPALQNLFAAGHPVPKAHPTGKP
jgi:hypothetical protein